MQFFVGSSESVILGDIFAYEEYSYSFKTPVFMSYTNQLQASDMYIVQDATTLLRGNEFIKLNT